LKATDLKMMAGIKTYYMTADNTGINCYQQEINDPAPKINAPIVLGTMWIIVR
jgi:hypothetical protein